MNEGEMPTAAVFLVEVHRETATRIEAVGLEVIEKTKEPHDAA
jgi:hypothetical protein